MLITRIGTSRTGRLTASMHPSKAPIDNRSLTTLMSYVKEVSTLISYYGDNNEIQGTWVQFFEKNSTFVLADIANQDINELHEKANRCIFVYLLIKTDKNHKDDYEEEKKKAKALLNFIAATFELFQLVEDWLKRAQKVEKPTVEFNLLDKILQVKSEYLKKSHKTLRVLRTYLIEEYNLDKYAAVRPLHLSVSDKKRLDKLLSLSIIFQTTKGIFLTIFHRISLLHSDAKSALEQEIFAKSNHEPLLAMIIGFLKIFSFQQEHFNKFAERHLDYYYYKILQQQKLAAVSDYAYVSFKLNKGASPYRLSKGTLLLADTNKKGIESHYETLHDLWVSEASIAALQTLYVSKNPEINFGSSSNLVSNIYYAPIANSKDGIGGPFDEINKSWSIVGKDQTELSPRQKTMIPGRVGFAISAPILHLEGGQRKIILTLEVSPEGLKHLLDLIEDIAQNEEKSISNIFYSFFFNSLEVFVTTETGWLEVEDFFVEAPEMWKDGNLKFEFTLEKDLPPIVAFGEEVEGEKFDTEWPVIEVLLKSGSSIYAYSFFKELLLEEVKIEVQVKNFSNLTISNAAGEFDNSTAFPLFGALPEKDSEFFIGSREIFLKNIECLEFDIEWKNLPDREGGFEAHYQAYINEEGEPLNIDNESFKVKISALSHAQYYPEKEETCQEILLFEIENNYLKPVTKIQNIVLDKLHLVPHLEEPIKLEPYHNDSRLGFIRFSLSTTRSAFGHKNYPRTLSDAITHNAFAKAEKVWWKRDVELVTVPKEPYDPIVKRISVNYTAKSTVSLIGKNAITTPEDLAWKLFQINPFGYIPSYANGQTMHRKLLQLFGWDGYLIIGIDDVKPGLPLNLLFEFSVKGKKALETPVKMSWRYLSDNEFIKFKKEDFLYDTTFNLTTTGVISLRIPEDINRNNTILSNKHYWLLVSASGKTSKILAEALQVNAHAVRVKWVDNGDESHYKSRINLPKIQSLLNKKGEISEVTQIGSFFGGHPKESEEFLWERLSERLRHKNRAVSIWDFERITLQKFPQIRQVKCISPDERGDFAQRGFLKMVVISEFMGRENLRPMVGFYTLNTIQKYLYTVSSPHVSLEVTNPNYEWLKLSMKILLKSEFDSLKGEYLEKLYREIEEFICPWIVRGDIRIGSGFKKKDLFNFIKDRPYIDYLTSFSVVHVFEREQKQDSKKSKLSEKKYEFDLHDSAKLNHHKEEIIPSCPSGILVPAEMHLIEFLDKFGFEPPRRASIEQMALETDFVIIGSEEEEKEETKRETKDRDIDYFEIWNLG